MIPRDRAFLDGDNRKVKDKNEFGVKLE